MFAERFEIAEDAEGLFAYLRPQAGAVLNKRQQLLIEIGIRGFNQSADRSSYARGVRS